MKIFLTGVLTGILLKKKLVCIFTNGINLYFSSIFYKKKISKPFVTKTFLICKITDVDVFKELFPVLKNKNASRVQPMWDYYENKKVIKITLDTPFIDEYISYSEFLNVLDSEYDIPLFESFSKLYIYVHYTINNKEYINVYSENSHINILDFNSKETELSKKYN